MSRAEMFASSTKLLKFVYPRLHNNLFLRIFLVTRKRIKSVGSEASHLGNQVEDTIFF